MSKIEGQLNVIEQMDLKIWDKFNFKQKKAQLMIYKIKY